MSKIFSVNIFDHFSALLIDQEKQPKIKNYESEYEYDRCVLGTEIQDEIKIKIICRNAEAKMKKYLFRWAVEKICSCLESLIVN